MSVKIKGIDVSKWQGSIDWTRVARDGVKFAMVRLGYGSKDGTACGVDSYYQRNVEGALKNGIAVGCYFYSYALSVEAVKREAAFVTQQLAQYRGQILYPIAFDIEDSSQAGLGQSTLTAMVTAFCSALESAGYYASFYCNLNWAKNMLDMNALARFDFWLAQWASAPAYSGHSFNMWQSSSKGSVAGISGNVDMDTAFVDFEAMIKKHGLNGYTGAVPQPEAGPGHGCCASSVVAVAAGEIGYLEKETNSQLDDKTANAGDENFTKYARDFDQKFPAWYNGKKNGFAWCDVFVDWCFLTAFGYENALRLLCQPERSCGAGCTYSLGYYRNRGQFHTSDPKPGDQIFFGNSISSSSHTGIVEKADGARVYTIEGNTSDRVARRSYALNDSKIIGYGRPAYDAETAPSAPVAPSIPPQKTVDELVDEVLAGQWGNGQERKDRLTAAGYDYATVQGAVNARCSAQKAAEKLAQDIATQLKSSGCDAAAVLKRVSEILA